MARRKNRSTKDIWYWLGRFIGKNYKLLMPALLIVCILVTVLIAMSSRRAAAKKQEPAPTTAAVNQYDSIIMEEDAHQEVNDLLRTYYNAMANGDLTTIERISSELSEEEEIRIMAIADNIESYPKLIVYTKEGPEEGSYVAYAENYVRFEGHDWEIPGLQTFYVCTREDGSLYLNTDDEQDSEITDYIQSVSAADDIVDLSNRITAEYNDLVSGNDEILAYLNDLSNEINVKVGEALAQLAAGQEAPAQEQAEETPEETPEETAEEPAEETPSEEAAPAAQEETAQEAASSYTKAKADDTVSVRAGAGTDEDKIGTVYPGDELKVVSYGEDWSKVEYEGQEGYVKSEYFTFSE